MKYINEMFDLYLACWITVIRKRKNRFFCIDLKYFYGLHFLEHVIHNVLIFQCFCTIPPDNNVYQNWIITLICLSYLTRVGNKGNSCGPSWYRHDKIWDQLFSSQIEFVCISVLHIGILVYQIHFVMNCMCDVLIEYIQLNIRFLDDVKLHFACSKFSSWQYMYEISGAYISGGVWD